MPRPVRRLLTLAVASVLLLVLTGTSAIAQDDVCGPAADATPSAETLDAARAAVVCLINEQRGANGLMSLTFSTALTAAGDAHANDMVSRGYFAHDSPEGAGPGDRAHATGYITGDEAEWGVFEDMGYEFGNGESPRTMVTDWMASAGHRANILAGRLRDIGVGLAQGDPGADEEAWTFVADFGFRVPKTREAGTPPPAAKAQPRSKPKPRCARGVRGAKARVRAKSRACPRAKSRRR